MRRLTILTLLALAAVLGGAWPVEAQTTTPQATITPAPYPYGYPTITIPSGGNIVLPNGGAIRTGTTAGNTALIQAYDTDTGPAYTTLLTATAGTTPSLQLTFNGSTVVADAANILALKNADTAQELRVYGATTGTKYFSIKHDGTNAILDISSGSNFYLRFAGANRIGIDSSTYVNFPYGIKIVNDLIWYSDGGGNIGAAGANRPANIYASGAITAAGNITGATLGMGASNAINWSGRSVIRSSADGLVSLLNNSETGFTRLNFGGATSAFPALSVTSATPPTLTVQAADGSSASNLSVSGTLTVSGDAIFGVAGAANSGLYAGAADGYVILAGGSSKATGASVIVFGQSHATLANILDLRVANVTKARLHASGGFSIGNTTDPGAGSLGVNGTLTVSGASVTIPYLASTTGTRYVCSNTSGVLSASASACSGTDPDALAAQVNALSLTITELRAEIAALKARQ